MKLNLTNDELLTIDIALYNLILDRKHSYEILMKEGKTELAEKALKTECDAKILHAILFNKIEY